jgi:tripartite ATP-independent transporter DctP family solute receptor
MRKKPERKLLINRWMFILCVSLLATLVGTIGSAEATDRITVKVASVLTPKHLQGVAMELFAKRAMELSKDRLKVEVYHNAQLGASERDYAEGLQLGTIQVAKIHSTPLTTIVPKVALLDLPYVFRDFDHLAKIVDGPIGEELNRELEQKGIKPIAWFNSGTRSIMSSKGPVRSPADLRGLKVRVMESRLMKDTLGAMGSIPTPMAYGELYTSLQQGVVDALENSPATLYDGKFYEVCKYLSFTRHFVTTGTLAIGTKFFTGLQKDLQQIILKAAKEAEAFERKEWKQYDEVVALEKLKSAGVKVNDDIDVVAFRRSVKTVQDEFSAKHGKDLIEKVINVR